MCCGHDDPLFDCEVSRVDPWLHLTDVLTQLETTSTKVTSLLPDVGIREHIPNSICLPQIGSPRPN
jgi:hypothetical protein